MRPKRVDHAKPYRSRLLSLALILLVAGLAGCASPAETASVATPPVTDDPAGGWAEAFMFGHRHAERESHELSSESMVELNHEALAPWAATRFGEADLLGDDHLVMASVTSGFFIIDITNRAQPVVVAFHPDPGYVADVKASRSGNFVFAGSQGAPSGIHAFYVGNRAAPTFAGYFPDANGCHMLSVYEDQVYCSGNGGVVILRYTESGSLVTFQQVGAYNGGLLPFGSDPVLTGTHATHDMTVQLDPLTGIVTMYVSFWDAGISIVDVTNPSTPVVLGAWRGEGAGEMYEGNVHTTMAGMVEGRRIIVMVPEFASVPAVYFLDATDLSDIQFLSAWTPLPRETWAEDDPTLFSTHNFQFVGGRVYLAMNHGGVWVIDAATLAAIATPKALGFLLPVNRDGDVVPLGNAPNTWDVVVKDGYIYASDTTGGLFTLHHVGDELGDMARTSFA